MAEDAVEFGGAKAPPCLLSVSCYRVEIQFGFWLSPEFVKGFGPSYLILIEEYSPEFLLT